QRYRNIFQARFLKQLFRVTSVSLRRQVMVSRSENMTNGARVRVPIKRLRRRHWIVSAKRTGGLGRGFESLIPTDVLDETFDPTAGYEQSSELRHIKHTAISANPD